MKFLKSLFLILVLVVFMFLTVCPAKADEAPAPFAKAKEYAMTATVNQSGNLILFLEYQNERGESCTAILGYIDSMKIIGVGIIQGEEIIVFQYCEEDGSYSVFYNGMIMAVGEEQASESAFDVFKILVEKRLI